MHSTAIDNHSDFHSPNLNNPSLRKLLRAHLLALPYGALLQVIARLLQCQGAVDVYPTGRHGFVGRNRAGGWDMEASLINPEELINPQAEASSTTHRTKCLVQVKQFDQLSVQQRTVDELRGCCLRAGAGRGMIVTTSRFSPVAEAAAEASVLAPITLIDGDQFLTLMFQHKLGVQQGIDGNWRVDTAFFQQMTEKQKRAEMQKGAKNVGKQSALDKPSHAGPVDPPGGLTKAAYVEPPPPYVLHLSVTVQASIQTLLPGAEPDWKQGRNNRKW